MAVITISQFQEGYLKGQISEVFSITVGTEKRVYGKWHDNQGEKVVYAVVP